MIPNKIKTIQEFIMDTIDHYNFKLIYKENNYPFLKKLDAHIQGLPAQEALQMIIFNSVAGNPSIGFFNKLPMLDNVYKVKTSCILVSLTPPDDIKLPTFFQTKKDDLPNVLNSAIIASKNYGLPAVVVIPESQLNNIISQELIHADSEQISPSISQSELHAMSAISIHKTSTDIDKEVASNVTSMLSYEDVKDLPYFTSKLIKKVENKTSEKSIIVSFEYENFFSYLSPTNYEQEIQTLCDTVKTENVNLYIDNLSYELLNNLTPHIMRELENYLYVYEHKNYIEKSDVKLCPGCPFPTVLNKTPSNTLVLSDVECRLVRDRYGLANVKAGELVGLANSGIQSKVIFIGNLSNFHSTYLKYVNNKSVSIVLLSDTDINPLHSFKDFNKIYKYKPTQHAMLPYSCDNIKKYKPLSIKEKKCSCLSGDNKVALCIEKTNCPALYEKDGKIYIQQDLCTGCENCVPCCPFKAI